MRKIINNILYSIGTFLRVIGYIKLIHCCRSMRDRIYTGIYKINSRKSEIPALSFLHHP